MVDKRALKVCAQDLGAIVQPCHPAPTEVETRTQPGIGATAANVASKEVTPRRAFSSVMASYATVSGSLKE